MPSPIPSAHIGTKDYSGPQNHAKYSGRLNENPIQFSISVCDAQGRIIKHLKFDPATDRYIGAVNVFTARSDATPSYTNNLEKLLARMKYIAYNAELFKEIAEFSNGNGIQVYYNYFRTSTEHSNLGSKGGTGLFFWPARTISKIFFTIPMGWYTKKDLYAILSTLRPDPSTYKISDGVAATVKSRLNAVNALRCNSKEDITRFFSTKVLKGQLAGVNFNESDDESTEEAPKEEPKEEQPEKKDEEEEKEEPKKDDEKKEKVDESDDLSFYEEEEEEPDVKDLPEVKESGLVECVKSLNDFSKIVLEGKVYDIPETHGRPMLDLAAEALARAKTLSKIAYMIAGEDADKLEY